MQFQMATSTPGQIISSLSAGTFKKLCKVAPAGTLEARRQSSGAVLLYWRYSIGSYSERVPIGLYDSTAAPRSLMPTSRGYSLAAATRAAEAMAAEHYSHKAEGGRPALELAAQEAKQRAAQEAKLAQEASLKAAEAEAAAKQYTLAKLLLLYCDDQKRLGRSSHRDARCVFMNHAIKPWPEVSALPANKITSDHIADMMRRTIGLGQGRTANKLRAYMRSAFQRARAARSNGSIPEEFKLFAVTYNPAADTVPDESANRTDKFPLSKEEIRQYWKMIKTKTDLQGAILRLHLLTGGQRIEQLVNLLTTDIRSDHIILHDGKGRPGKTPRNHAVPLIPIAAEALKSCGSRGQGIFALSTDGGITHVTASTLSRWAVKLAKPVIPTFQAKRIRSTVETLLSESGVNSEHRGWLQSHGITGVQNKHYNDYDYLKEKRDALETLYKLLND